MVRSCLIRFAAVVAIFVPLGIIVVAPMYTNARQIALQVRVVDPSPSVVVSPQASPSPEYTSPLEDVITSLGLVTPETSIVGGPTVSVAMTNEVLASAGSPAQGTGQALYDLSQTYQIDNAFALAVFQKESTYGLYGVAASTRALGNIICAGYPTCEGRFRAYPTWEAGYEDFYRLIVREYVGAGLDTVGEIFPVYAPTIENDTALYIQDVCASMMHFRQV